MHRSYTPLARFPERVVFARVPGRAAPWHGRFIDAYYGREYRLAYTWRPRTNVDFFVVGDRLPGQATQVSAKVLFTL